MTLTQRVRGPVRRPGDAGYDAECAGFQTAWRHRPDLVVGATCAADVRAAVRHAAAEGLPVSVQATGHGLAGPTRGGVLVATRRMAGAEVDAAGRTAWIEAGTRWDRVVREAAAYGLAPLSGSAPHTGAVAYTLGGGLGLLARKYGYAADHVHEIDVVTADGRLRRVAPGRDPDLFWALRGGRGNFGIVTGMRIGLVPVARLYGGGLYFPAGPEVLRAFAEWTRAVPEEMTASVGLIPYPDLPAVPGPLRGRHVAHVRIAYLGAAETGERLVAPLRAIGPRLVDALAEMPYAESGAIYRDPPDPHAYEGGNLLLSGLDTAALDRLFALTGPDAPVPCVVDLRHLGGALARTPEAPSAVGHRPAAYLLRVLSPLDGLDPDAVRAAHRRAYEAMAPWSTGGRSLNFLYGAPDDLRDAYEPGTWRRLTEVKAAYDPANLFRRGLAIPPAAQRSLVRADARRRP